MQLLFTVRADEDLRNLEQDASKKNILKAVRKILAFMENNIRHPSLQTHEFTNLKGIGGEKVFEAYVQQNTPVAYRVFWHYGPDEIDEGGKRIAIITIIAITPHP